MSLYSIVVPVYNSEHTLEQLYERLRRVFDEALGEPFELILVDDSSKDASFCVMQRLREGDKRVKIIQLARNFGQPSAVLCGFSHVKGDFVITMDDDLQHRPEEIPKMIDVVYGLGGRDCRKEDIARVYDHLLRIAETGVVGEKYLHMGQRSSEKEVL